MAKKTWLATADGNWGTAANWSPAAVPIATDEVHIPAGTPAITGGLNQSAVALAAVFIEAGHRLPIGTAATQLQLNCTSLSSEGSGQYYIDLGASAAPVSVPATAVGSATVAGLYLKGAGITNLVISGGNVAVAGLVGETATVATVRCSGNGTKVQLGPGVTVTTIAVSGGTLTAYCGFTTANVYGGTFNHFGTVAGTSVNTYGGLSVLRSTGTITNNTMLGGNTRATSGLPRTITNNKLNPGANFEWDPALVTITTHVAPTFPIRITSSAIT